ncbi:hypothetical protein [Streptomyces sp. NBC_01304]|uniref:hypothetical protein n=1 Tax=Streptomyces sp. NBC_01304 TaxID=2903818 RepID=UPI002E13162E|nr:hypothetical protein OG430_33880 [Streptomyces sp. NBC_01304]
MTTTDLPGGTSPSPLVPSAERDKLALRLQQALNGFVDDPRRSTADAESVLEETVDHVTRALQERRTAIRTAAQDTPDAAGAEDAESDSKTSAGTEELRLALRQYRDLSERLLRL